MPGDPRELDSLKGKLNVLSGVLRLGHEAFQKPGIEAVASHIVNNSRMLSLYGRSCVIDMRGLSPAVLAVSGQPVPKQDSEYCSAIRKLASALPLLTAPLLLNASGTEGVSKAAADEAAGVFEGRPKASMFMIPLPCPAGDVGAGPAFLWSVEFFEGETPQDISILGLLAQHYAEALWHRAILRPGIFSGLLKLHELNPVRAVLIVVAIFFLCLCLIRVRQYAVSDFEIAPASESVSYSQLAGTLRKVLKANGEVAAVGDSILEFDTDELNFKLASALKEFEQVSAELDAARQKSFASPELIAKVQLLDIKREQDKVEIERTRWMLSKSILNAQVGGVVVMDERERMEGKAVRPGDKLFEIIPQDSLIAEIFLSERDASVIGRGMTVSLYLHTQPETPIHGELISVSPKPSLTDDRRFCYILKFKPEGSAGLICGMRGVARVGGEKVSLGYHLFRSVVLWWRKI